MYSRGDFHTHSTESDGRLSPSELVNLAKSNNIDIMSLTDHDTTNGIESALTEGIKTGIKVIPGMELSTNYNNESIHILAYFKDDTYKQQTFQDFLKGMKDYRISRAEQIVSKLHTYFDIHIDYEKVLKKSKGVVARPHIAKEIIDSGYPYTFEYIFKNILNPKSPAYVPNRNLKLQAGITLLKSVNSLVVLAHPVLVKKTPVTELMKFDFDGIEAIYPINTPSETEQFIEIANTHNKFITAGSDFHSGDKEDTKHGTLTSVSLDESRIQIFLKKLLSK